MPIFLRALAGALLAFAVTAHAATEVAGVRFEDDDQIAGQALHLNGAGLRTRLFFKVYAMGLYLPAAGRNAEQAVADPGPKRIRIVTLRELTARQFAEALIEGVHKNHDPAALEALGPRLKSFESALLAIDKAPEGTRVQIDFAPDRGTQLFVNEQARGEVLPGADFYAALLRVWLGQAPADADLKGALTPARH